MAINISLDDLDTFARNGISEDAIRDTINAYRQEGIADEEIYNKFQQKLQDIKKAAAPGVVESFGMNAGNAFAFGQGSRIAGVANTGAGRVLMQVLNPAAGLLAPKPTLEELDPRKYKEQYQEGKQQFETKQEAANLAHPVASTIGEVGGTLAGLAVPAGALGNAVRAGVAGTRLGQAGRIGSIAARAAGEATAFGVYEGVREGFGEGRADAMAALKGGGKGVALGAALGILGGGAKAVEENLVQSAERLIKTPGSSKLLNAVAQKIVQHPVASERAALAAGLAAEGVTLGAVPAALEGKAPTATDIATGVGFAAGGRAVGEGLSWGLGKTREWITSPSEREVKVMEGKGVLEALQNKEKALEQLKKTESKAIKELETIDASIQENAQKFEKIEGRAPAEIQEELNQTTREQRILKEGKAGELLEELDPHLNQAEENITGFMRENGWEPGRRPISKEGDSRYLHFEKDGKEATVRVSGHKPSNKDFDAYWDINKSPEANLREIGNNILLSEKAKGIQKKISPLQERIKRDQARLKEIAGEDETLMSDIEGKRIISSRITPTEKQIKSYMKADKTLTREQAIDLATSANKKAALAKGGEKKTFRQVLRSAVERIRTEFNVVRPIEKIEEDYYRVTGKKLPYNLRSSVSLYKLANGGEWEYMSEPVVKAMDKALKMSPKSIEKYGEYAQAKKNLQFKQLHGEAIDANDLRKIKLYENDKAVQLIDKEVRKMNETVLDGLYQSGKMDKSTYEQWKKNDSYVPSRIIKEYIDGEPIVSRELDAFSKKYAGTGLVYENSAISSLMQGKALHRLSELNKAKRQFVDTAKKVGEATLENPNSSYAGGKIRFNKKNQIVVWADGKPQIWNVPENVARYFNPEPIAPQTGIQKVLGALMRTYKAGTTATSLGFSYSNLFRDVQSAVMGSKYGGFIGVGSIRNSAKELMENTPLAQFFRREVGGKTILTTEQIPQLAKDSVKEAVDILGSAENAFPDGSQRNLLARGFTTAAPEYARKLMKVSSKGVKGGLEALTYAGQLGEETTRFSVFKSVLEAKAKNNAQFELWMREPNKIPKDVLAEAGNEAREVTLNFKKQAAPWVEKANRYFLPYFKPSILGAMRGFEVLTNPEIAPRAWRYIINLGVLQGLINGRMGTKEELERYEAINNDITGKTFVLQGKDGKLYSLPLSQEFGPLSKLFALATEKIYRGATKQAREDIGREAWSAVKQEASNLIPAVGYVSPSNAVPQVFKPYVELSINRDLFSKVPIEPEYLKALPPSMRYNQSTSRTLVKLAEIASKFGVEVSPMKIQHVVKGTISSTGKEMLALTDNILATILSTDLRPKQDMENNPLIRRFMVDMYAPYNQYSMDAREIVEENKQGYNAIEKEKVDIDSERGKRYSEQYYVYDTIKGYADELNQLYKERKQLLEELRQVGEYNRAKYENGDWSKGQMLYENDKVMREAEGALTYYKDYQRQLEMAIIQDAKEAKKEYKNNPR